MSNTGLSNMRSLLVKICRYLADHFRSGPTPSELMIITGLAVVAYCCVIYLQRNKWVREMMELQLDSVILSVVRMQQIAA